jgi:hypothetical protein
VIRITLSREPSPDKFLEVMYERLSGNPSYHDLAYLRADHGVALVANSLRRALEKCTDAWDSAVNP